MFRVNFECPDDERLLKIIRNNENNIYEDLMSLYFTSRDKHNLCFCKHICISDLHILYNTKSALKLYIEFEDSYINKFENYRIFDALKQQKSFISLIIRYTDINEHQEIKLYITSIEKDIKDKDESKEDIEIIDPTEELRVTFKCLRANLFYAITRKENNNYLGLYYRNGINSNSYSLISRINSNELGRIDSVTYDNECEDALSNIINEINIHMHFYDNGQLHKILNKAFDVLVEKAYTYLYLYGSKNPLPNILDTYEEDPNILPIYIKSISLTPLPLSLFKDEKEKSNKTMNKDKKNNCKKSTIDYTINSLIEKYNEKYEIKKVIFNGKATIVIWNDGTKTITKWNNKEERYDPEKGLALCFAKKALGNKFGWWDKFIEYIKDADKINLDKCAYEEIAESIDSINNEDNSVQSELNKVFTPCKPKEELKNNCETCKWGNDNISTHSRREDRPCKDCTIFHSKYERFIPDKDAVKSTDNLVIKSCTTCVDSYTNKPNRDGSEFCSSCRHFSLYRPVEAESHCKFYPNDMI